jgi:hypothetical protein
VRKKFGVSKNGDFMLGVPDIILATAVCYLPYSSFLFYCSNDTVCHNTLKYFTENICING